MSEDDLKNVTVEIGKIDYLQVKQKGLENGSIAGTVNNCYFNYLSYNFNCYLNDHLNLYFNYYFKYNLILHVIIY